MLAVPPRRRSCLASYNNTITDLRDEGDLVNVVSVAEDIAEQETVNCTSKVTEFDTTANVTFEGDPDNAPSNEELESLASSFVESYNSANALNSEICDSFFRVAVEAKIDHTDENSGRVRKLKTKGIYKYVLRIRGHCRGCQRNTRLFGGTTTGHRVLYDDVDKGSLNWDKSGSDDDVLFLSRGSASHPTRFHCQCYKWRMLLPCRRA